jgi:hypothetical protein
MDGLEATGAEMPFPVKSQSLRDKMKRRREAIQNLEASVASNSTPQEEVAHSAEVKKPKVEEPERAAKKERTSKEPVDELSALLSMQSSKEREERSQQEEILTLLRKPSAKELSLMNIFKSQDGGGVKEFCSYSTKKECMKVHRSKEPCAKLHFVKILQVWNVV